MNPWRGLGTLPKEVWILSTATLINRAGTMALSFLVLYLTRTLGFFPRGCDLLLHVVEIERGTEILVFDAGRIKTNASWESPKEALEEWFSRYQISVLR